jgi:ABC-type transport system involved in cytochrome c biogenesis permease subunit
MRTSLLLPAAALLALTLTRADAAGLPPSIDITPLRSLVVQHDGRYMPLDTLARDVVGSVTGSQRYAGRDPVLVLLAWTFDATAWQHEPLIPIRNESLRAEIQLPVLQRTFSFSDLAEHEHFQTLLRGPGGMGPGKKADALQQKVRKIGEELVALQQVFQGLSIRLIPDPTDPLAAWQTVVWLVQSKEASMAPVRDAWMALGSAFLADDNGAFSLAAATFTAELQKLPAAHRPPATTIASEVRYNQLGLYRKAWITLALATALAAIAFFVRRRSFDLFAAAVTLAGTAMFTYALSLRWAVAGRIPASNFFESLLFLSWGAAAFAVVAFFAFRHRSVPLTAAAIGAVALCMADCLPLDPFIRPVAPVLLDTFWMSVHVPVIMISYAILAIAVLIAHVQIAATALLPADRPVIATLDRLHYGYVLAGSLLLLVGIATGSMWAASSWGRYWGWDPKEVWSLVALLGYMAAVHVRLDRSRRSRWALLVALALVPAVFALIATRLAPLTLGKAASLAVAGVAMAYFILARSLFATAAKSIMAFWLIIMTYVGVNYILGTGLHSYGFGMGAVASRMCLAGAIDLGIVLVFMLIHALRYRSGPPATGAADDAPRAAVKA